jgi:hypothetical protein
MRESLNLDKRRSKGRKDAARLVAVAILLGGVLLIVLVSALVIYLGRRQPSNSPKGTV